MWQDFLFKRRLKGWGIATDVYWVVPVNTDNWPLFEGKSPKDIDMVFFIDQIFHTHSIVHVRQLTIDGGLRAVDMWFDKFGCINIPELKDCLIDMTNTIDNDQLELDTDFIVEWFNRIEERLV